MNITQTIEGTWKETNITAILLLAQTVIVTVLAESSPEARIVGLGILFVTVALTGILYYAAITAETGWKAIIYSIAVALLATDIYSASIEPANPGIQYHLALLGLIVFLSLPFVFGPHE